ncbi:hypothetical protein An15g00710 [Aspergillus niger]|uniref:Uncharacterized protein n=2 Tax=Aspergillus niger TaxID=5061 RepID=A2R4K2_ASPNC|nr:hypothetical protein An15g00710 [Aspergillus niger]CAK42240.1 hypothetical protein An15g00710 [Aspergillus niger]
MITLPYLTGASSHTATLVVEFLDIRLISNTICKQNPILQRKGHKPPQARQREGGNKIKPQLHKATTSYPASHTAEKSVRCTAYIINKIQTKGKHTSQSSTANSTRLSILQPKKAGGKDMPSSSEGGEISINRFSLFSPHEH